MLLFVPCSYCNLEVTNFFFSLYLAPSPQKVLKMAKSCILNPSTLFQFDAFCDYECMKHKKSPFCENFWKAYKNQTWILTFYWYDWYFGICCNYREFQSHFKFVSNLRFILVWPKIFEENLILLQQDYKNGFYKALPSIIPPL